MNPSDVVDLVGDQLWPAYAKELDRLKTIDLWYRWEHEQVRLPAKATPELKALTELAKTPWLRLVVRAISQGLFVDGYRSPDSRDNTSQWAMWNANDMDARQVPLHQAALAYGHAYVLGLPGEDSLSGQAMAKLRGRSPRRMLAFYADETDDDWPMFAIDVQISGNQAAIAVYDEESEYRLTADKDGGKPTFVERSDHGLGVCPVVRYAAIDLDGRADGEVQPYISVASRIDKTVFDRLMVQHFASWKVRTVSGLAEPDDDEEAARKKLQLRQDDLLVAEDPDTKFGTLDETPLDGPIAAHEADIEALAAVTQIASHNLTGKMVNLSAEALAAARAQQSQLIATYKTAYGKSHGQTFRLGAKIVGDDQGAADMSAVVTWQDTEIRSLAQAADALTKLASPDGLGVPRRELWPMIPGVTKSDVDAWIESDQQDAANDPMAVLLRAGGSAPPAG